MTNWPYARRVPLDVVLDRSSPVPLYYQLAQQLERAVQDGVLKPGDRLEPEVDLAERTGLSRPTVRQAIQELVKKGILVRRRGVGTQVVHARVRRPVELTSLNDVLKRDGREPSTRVLRCERTPASAEVAAALGVEEGTPVYEVERLRLTGVEPLALMHNWLPADLLELSAELLERHGLYELLRQAGVHLQIASQQIGARAARRTEAKQLEVAVGAPLLTMQRTTYDESGRAVEWASHCYRADSYSFDTTLVSGG